MDTEELLRLQEEGHPTVDEEDLLHRKKVVLDMEMPKTDTFKKLKHVKNDLFPKSKGERS